MTRKLEAARKTLPALLLAGLLLIPPACAGDADTEVKAGDLIFQSLNTSQSLALRIATGSEYTHCGIILEKDGKLQVLEAIGPVTWTPLADWIARGEKGHYVLMRLKDAGALTPEALAAMLNDVATFAGKPYDFLFQWSDDKIYCSELVWKLYQRNTGLELGPLRRIADYNLDSEEVLRIAHQRYGTDIPLDEKATAPSDIMASDLLEVVAKK
ncbi:MAG: YiiX family permuted papain-like enzyme [Deltaproteobacteria bacterium]|jgi:hypothetical protein|nr:YiiX family permuted papain-like enzyme [Deltaproteobacteria bacterium]